MISARQADAIRYRGVETPKKAPSRSTKLSVPLRAGQATLEPSQNKAAGNDTVRDALNGTVGRGDKIPPGSVRNNTSPSFTASDVLAGVLKNYAPADSAFSPQRINPAVTLKGGRVTGRLYCSGEPRTPLVTPDGLIIFTTDWPDAVLTARLDPRGGLVAGADVSVTHDNENRPILVGRDTFVDNDDHGLQLMRRVADDELEELSGVQYQAMGTPFFTPDHRIVGASALSLVAYKVHDDELMETGRLRTDGDATWSVFASPFQLENGVIVSVARGEELGGVLSPTSLVTSRLDSAGALHRLASLTVGQDAFCLPAPKNHVVFRANDESVITVFRVSERGELTAVDKVEATMSADDLIVSPSGLGIIGAPNGTYDDQFYVPIHFSARGKLELNMSAAFESSFPPVLTQSGALIRTSSEGVHVEQLDDDGTRTPCFSVPLRDICARVTVIHDGTILVPTKRALVAVGGP